MGSREEQAIHAATHGGIVHGLTNESYHAGPGWSVSGVKRFRRSPYHFHALKGPHGAPPKEPTAAMVNGTLVHCATLEPDEMPRRYAVGPDGPRTSKAWKDHAAWAAMTGLEPITGVQYIAALRQAAALRTLPDVDTLLSDGQPEVSAFWRDEATGVLCKCRPDWVSPVADGTGVILVDVKTTADASPEAFARSAANLGYHLQAAWYCHGYAQATGLEVHGMVFACVESEFPHAVAAYMLDDEAIAKGRAACDAALVAYAECERTCTWPSYPQDIVTLQLPPWA